MIANDIKKWRSNGTEIKILNIICKIEKEKVFKDFVKTLKTYDELDEVLFEWFMQACSRNSPINGAILSEKGLEISLSLGLKDFTASNGWIDKSHKIYNLT